jgi:hypothetical protein
VRVDTALPPTALAQCRALCHPPSELGLDHRLVQLWRTTCINLRLRRSTLSTTSNLPLQTRWPCPPPLSHSPLPSLCSAYPGILLDTGRLVVTTHSQDTSSNRLLRPTLSSLPLPAHCSPSTPTAARASWTSHTQRREPSAQVTECGPLPLCIAHLPKTPVRSFHWSTKSFLWSHFPPLSARSRLVVLHAPRPPAALVLNASSNNGNYEEPIVNTSLFLGC